MQQQGFACHLSQMHAVVVQLVGLAFCRRAFKYLFDSHDHFACYFLQASSAFAFPLGRDFAVDCYLAASESLQRQLDSRCVANDFSGGRGDWAYFASAAYFFALSRRGQQPSDRHIKRVVFIHCWAVAAAWLYLLLVEKTGRFGRSNCLLLLVLLDFDFSKRVGLELLASGQNFIVGSAQDVLKAT